MPLNERLVDAAAPIARMMRTPADVDRARRIERGLDNEGRPVLEPREFIAMRAPDGSVWRYRIDNSGNWLPGVKET